MPNENEGQSLREYGNRKKRYKKRRRAIIIALLLVLIVMGAAFVITIYNRNYDNYKILKTPEVSGANAAGYLSYGSSVVKYSKDGAVAIDKDGSLIWNGSFEMSDPIADTCGKYVVIADRDGKSIHIFNEKGEIGNFQTLYDIVKVEVAHQGVVAALMEQEDQNYIVLYDKGGMKLGEKITSTSIEGYPMDISLSEDGKKLVTSYLSYTDGMLLDKVSFFNFGEVGQNEAERLMAGINFDEGVIVPRVEFINNDTVCAFKDNGFRVYSMKERPKEIHEENIEGKIQSVLYNQTYIGIIIQAEGTSSKRIMVYDLKGNKVLDKALDFDYETIYLTEKEIIMYNNMSCVIMKLNGKTKFRYTFDSNIEAICPINNLDRYYFANDNKLYEIQLKE